MEELNKGNSLFVDENYEDALTHYNKACTELPNSFEAFFRRSQCHQKLDSINDALQDINNCIKLEPNNPKSYLKKGQYCFELEEYDTALSVFEKGLALEPENSQLKTWVRKTKAELEQSQPAPVPTPTPAAPVAAKPTTTTTATPAAATTITPTPTTTTPAAPAKPQLPVPSSGTKVRHEWYQTGTHVTLTIFAKFVTKENSNIEIKDKSINISFAMATGSEYSFDIDFFDPVVPAESTTKFYSTKVEIVLKKSRAIRWDNLEFTGKEGPVGTIDTPAPKPLVSPYQTNKNWDKIDAGEDKEGDPLNRVFQDIFSKGSEEQQRAMMKSFVESGGTVLSTNWEDVAKKTVKGAPPKGMEVRSWADGEKVVTDKKKKKEWEDDSDSDSD
ncbi:TPR repeat-containing protein [Heterostelium album PN500]|uniref:TPR repeat-containing protein n=1 Tax=Heterostelium pallidum (strain ATCC 26659 / Pp 5 / PN500) TaxID=670386 RepID=D3BLN9_HETP5|nr:TPR repeat-containing protein [Heterostelium album PN500]EFA77490.1 TPR repeat-containing protein [Heterostelium album PN500]|eukprot:XP_020429618.1 TPR repeat-containing protein [Heterostelium album PN500]